MEMNEMQKSCDQNRIAVVIVLYNPSSDDIQRISVLSSAYSCYVVDNSESTSIDTAISSFCYIYNNGNLGIAEAQNRALRKIMEDDYDYVIFLDQDSRVEQNYCHNIMCEFARIDEGSLAILGPSVLHRENGEEYKSVVHHYTVNENGFSQRKHIISSGSCISVKALHDIGLMESGLFIDYVDYEWCWRAASKGYKCGITNRMSIYHKVGQRELTIGKYKVIVSAPGRYYYQYRNFLWLIRRKYVPLQWKFATGTKFLLRLIYFPLYVKGGYECWKYMIKGIKDGLWARK